MNTGKSEELIVWDFQVARGGMVGRYGHIGEIYYKQHLPAGIVASNRYPPRVVDRRLYELAKKYAEK